MFPDLDNCRPLRIGIYSRPKLCVVLECRAHKAWIDIKVTGNLVDIAARIPHLSRDLSNEDARARKACLRTARS